MKGFDQGAYSWPALTPQAQEVEALDAQDEADKTHHRLSEVPQIIFALVA